MMGEALKIANKKFNEKWEKATENVKENKHIAYYWFLEGCLSELDGY